MTYILLALSSAMNLRVELRRAMPDEFVGHGDVGRLLPFAQHELKAAGLAI